VSRPFFIRINLFSKKVSIRRGKGLLRTEPFFKLPKSLCPYVKNTAGTINEKEMRPSIIKALTPNKLYENFTLYDKAPLL
jgi:hypothetical protein